MAQSAGRSKKARYRILACASGERAREQPPWLELSLLGGLGVNSLPSLTEPNVVKGLTVGYLPSLPGFEVDWNAPITVLHASEEEEAPQRLWQGREARDAATLRVPSASGSGYIQRTFEDNLPSGWCCRFYPYRDTSSRRLRGSARQHWYHLLSLRENLWLRNGVGGGRWMESDDAEPSGWAGTPRPAKGQGSPQWQWISPPRGGATRPRTPRARTEAAGVMLRPHSRARYAKPQTSLVSAASCRRRRHRRTAPLAAGPPDSVRAAADAAFRAGTPRSGARTLRSGVRPALEPPLPSRPRCPRGACCVTRWVLV